jgi:hypothetical protein
VPVERAFPSPLAGEGTGVRGDSVTHSTGAHIAPEIFPGCMCAKNPRVLNGFHCLTLPFPALANFNLE